MSSRACWCLYWAWHFYWENYLKNTKNLLFLSFRLKFKTIKMNIRAIFIVLVWSIVHLANRIDCGKLTLIYSNSSDSCQQPLLYRSRAVTVPYPIVSNRFRPICLITDQKRSQSVGYGTVTVRLRLSARIGRITEIIPLGWKLSYSIPGGFII